MKINLKQAGQPVADFAVSGALVTIAGVVIDTASRESDIAVVVEVRENADGPGEGGNGAYLAQIEIPARRYVTHHVPGDTEDEPPTETREPAEFDPDSVVVTLWPATR